MIALGCDHGGYELKQEIIKYLEEKKIPTSYWENRVTGYFWSTSDSR